MAMTLDRPAGLGAGRAKARLCTAQIPPGAVGRILTQDQQGRLQTYPPTTPFVLL